MKFIIFTIFNCWQTLDELPLEAETVEKGYSLGAADKTGLPKIHGLPTTSMHSTGGSIDSFTSSPKNPRSSRKTSHSGELHFPFANADSNGSGRNYMPGLYPSVDP